MVQMNFRADAMAICASRLAAAGYQQHGGTEADLQAYLSVLDRRVPRQKRYIYKAATYSVPAHLSSGEQQFLKAVQDGADLRPYQSTRLDDPTFTDGMLSDFGVQHFHVGIGAHPTRAGFKARTDPVMFAMVVDNGFHCIGFYRHPPHDPDAWSRQEVLDTIHANWPKLLEPFVAAGVTDLSQKFSDAELGQLRKNGVNTFTQRPDGTVHMSPGLGITTAKGSLKTVRQEIRLGELCDDLEQQVEQRFGAAAAGGSALVSARLTEVAGAMVVEASDGTIVPVRDFAISAL